MVLELCLAVNQETLLFFAIDNFNVSFIIFIVIITIIVKVESSLCTVHQLLRDEIMGLL